MNVRVRLLGALVALGAGAPAVVIAMLLLQDDLCVGASCCAQRCSSLALGVPAALADGDPASDYLLVHPAFVPAGRRQSLRPMPMQLTAVLAAAKTKGYVIRVALIKTRYDMGSVTILYRKPKQYAHFLGQELHFVYKGRLLVVMPNGYGYARGGRAAAQPQQAIVDRLPAPGATRRAARSLGHARGARACRRVRRPGRAAAAARLDGDERHPRQARDRRCRGARARPRRRAAPAARAAQPEAGPP